MDKRYSKIVNIIGWIIFLMTSVLYLLTMYPTVSFWDSGEFIMTASNLSVGHQPGAPFYQLVGALVNIFSFGHARLTAPLINAVSAVASGLSIMLLYHLFLYLFNKYSPKPIGNTFAAILSSLTFAVSDSFWTCSTEAEVYSLAFLSVTLCIWLIIRWEENPGEKYFLLISLILGVSYGIHPLCLLVIPALVFIIWFHYRKITLKGIAVSILLSAVLLFVYTNAFQWIVALNAHSVILFASVLTVLTVLSLYISSKKNLPLMNSTTLCVVFFIIGCSVYLVPAVRSSQNLPSDEYPAFTAKHMKDYVSRSAYVHPPIVYGAAYTAPPAEDFVIKNNKITPVFDSKFNMFFPRMWNYMSPSAEDNYASWVGRPKNTVTVNGEDRAKPSWLQNLQFFLNYQIGYMYVRYLMWNFCGRTNDNQGYGDITNGTWQTGFYHIDKLLDIDEGKTALTSANKANNRYFAIPFLLCIIGVFYHIIKDSKRFLFVGTVFIMYSLAIVVYTNVSAYEPRERDYVFLPSYMAVSLWMGIGILGICQIIANIIRVKHPRYILPLFIIVPVWMLIQNFDDHDHRRQYTARNFAVSLLNSCDSNSVLFVDADNDTYPLWYVQNVEKIRQDVRVINRQMLNNPYYIGLLTKPMPQSKALKLHFGENDLADGVMDEVQLTPGFDTLDISKAVAQLKEYNSQDIKLGNHVKQLHCNKFSCQTGSGTVVLTSDDGAISKSDMVILDIIASNTDRKIYFSSYSFGDFMNADTNLHPEGLALRLGGCGLNSDNVSFDKTIKGFEMKNFDKDIYYNETERSFVTFFTDNIRSLAYRLTEQGQKGKALTLVNRTLNDIPYNIHRYSYNLADFALISQMCLQNASNLMETSVREFEVFMNRYNTATVRFQAQNRLEAAKAVSFYLNLCTTCEMWNAEQLRVIISETFFGIIRPYMEVTKRQRKIMSLDEENYMSEIEAVDALTSEIEDFASHYEEEL